MIISNVSNIIYSEFTTQMPHVTDLQTKFPGWFKQKVNSLYVVPCMQTNNTIFTLNFSFSCRSTVCEQTMNPVLVFNYLLWQVDHYMQTLTPLV